MPTARPRHSVTETDAIAEALDDAAVVWPDLRDDRAALLRKLVEAGHRSVAPGDARSLVRAAGGAASGSYPPDALSILRADWPE